MSPEGWLAGFVWGLIAGIPVSIFLHAATPPVVDAVLARAHRGRH